MAEPMDEETRIQETAAAMYHKIIEQPAIAAMVKLHPDHFNADEIWNRVYEAVRRTAKAEAPSPASTTTDEETRIHETAAAMYHKIVTHPAIAALVSQYPEHFDTNEIWNRVHNAVRKTANA